MSWTTKALLATLGLIISTNFSWAGPLPEADHEEPEDTSLCAGELSAQFHARGAQYVTDIQSEAYVLLQGSSPSTAPYRELMASAGDNRPLRDAYRFRALEEIQSAGDYLSLVKPTAAEISTEGIQATRRLVKTTLEDFLLQTPNHWQIWRLTRIISDNPNEGLLDGRIPPAWIREALSRALPQAKSARHYIKIVKAARRALDPDQKFTAEIKAVSNVSTFHAFNPSEREQRQLVALTASVPGSAWKIMTEYQRKRNRLYPR